MRRFTADATRDLTIENLGDYVHGVLVALAVRADLAGLSSPWQDLLARCDAHDARKRAARRGLNGARVAYAFHHAEFANTVKKLSSETYHLAGKDVRAEPYVSFFGAVKVAEIQRFGLLKATAYGRSTVELEAPVLSALTSESAKDLVRSLLAELHTATAALEEAGRVREDAASELTGLDIGRRLLVRQTLDLVAQTEVGILTRYQGRRDLVDAILALTNTPPRSGLDPTGSKRPTRAPES